MFFYHLGLLWENSLLFALFSDYFGMFHRIRYDTNEDQRFLVEFLVVSLVCVHFYVMEHDHSSIDQQIVAK